MQAEIPANSAATLRLELTHAVHELRERGLYQSAVWAAEMLVALPQADREAAPAAIVPTRCSDPAEEERYLLAKGYFDTRVCVEDSKLSCEGPPVSVRVEIRAGVPPSSTSAGNRHQHEGDLPQTLQPVPRWRKEKRVRVAAAVPGY
jgi:hypothetical protein